MDANTNTNTSVFDFLPSFDSRELPETPQAPAGQYFARVRSLTVEPPTEKNPHPSLLMKLAFEGNGMMLASDGETPMDKLPAEHYYLNLPIPADKDIIRVDGESAWDKNLKSMKYLFSGLGFSQIDNATLARVIQNGELNGILVQFAIEYNPNPKDENRPFKNFRKIKAVATR